jgi:hypothetical protein
MGYATQPGFRAGTCTPFLWFDLVKNRVTNLKIYPVTFMEGTLGEDLGLSVNEAEEKIDALIKVVKQYKGCFICIWHNHTINDKYFWKGWKIVFEKTLGKLKSVK